MTYEEAFTSTVEKLKVCESGITTLSSLSTSIKIDYDGSTTGELRKGIIDALGALTGLLAAALVIVTMGWIVSCVYLMRKNKQR